MNARLRIICHDRPGIVAELAQTLGDRNINLIDVEAHTHGDDAVVLLHVDEPDAALAVLTVAGFNCMTDEVVLARVDDRPGALAKLSKTLLDANVEVRSVTLVQRDEGHAIVAMSTGDNARARAVLADYVI
ncbi:MAG: ACT domain-containing protein [Vulcanimicrobiaceae bacterium]